MNELTERFRQIRMQVLTEPMNSQLFKERYHSLRKERLSKPAEVLHDVACEVRKGKSATVFAMEHSVSVEHIHNWAEIYGRSDVGHINDLLAFDRLLLDESELQSAMARSQPGWVENRMVTDGRADNIILNYAILCGAPDDIDAHIRLAASRTDAVLTGYDLSQLLDSRAQPWCSILQELDFVLACEPERVEAHFLRGQLLAYTDSSIAAAACHFEKCLAREQDLTRFGLAAARSWYGRSTPEIDQCLAVLDQLPAGGEGAPALKLRATCLARKKKYVRAVADLTRYLESEPWDAEAFLLRAWCRAALGKTESANDDLQHFLCSEITYSPRTHLFLSQTYLHLDRLDDAERQAHMAERADNWAADWDTKEQINQVRAAIEKRREARNFRLEKGRGEPPQFRYFPGAYDNLKKGVIRSSKAECIVCEKTPGLIYVGPVFCADGDADSHICPWCIADGEAGGKLGATFNPIAAPCDAGNRLGSISEIPEEVVDEIASRTPGVPVNQEGKWFFHCSDGAQFIGSVGWKELQSFGTQAVEALRAQAVEVLGGVDDAEVDDWMKQLVADGSPAGYLFRCEKCGAFGGFSDCD